MNRLASLIERERAPLHAAAAQAAMATASLVGLVSLIAAGQDNLGRGNSDDIATKAVRLMHEARDRLDALILQTLDVEFINGRALEPTDQDDMSDAVRVALERIHYSGEREPAPRLCANQYGVKVMA